MYYCESCEKYFIEEEVGRKGIAICPYCHNEEISELTRGEIADLINDLYLDGRIVIDDDNLEHLLNCDDGIVYEIKKAKEN